MVIGKDKEQNTGKRRGIQSVSRAPQTTVHTLCTEQFQRIVVMVVAFRNWLGTTFGSLKEESDQRRKERSVNEQAYTFEQVYKSEQFVKSIGQNIKNTCVPFHCSCHATRPHPSRHCWYRATWLPLVWNYACHRTPFQTICCSSHWSWRWRVPHSYKQYGIPHVAQWPEKRERKKTKQCNNATTTLRRENKTDADHRPHR